MKIRLMIVIVLFVNLLIITGLHNSLLKELINREKAKDTYMVNSSYMEEEKKEMVTINESTKSSENVSEKSTQVETHINTEVSTIKTGNNKSLADPLVHDSSDKKERISTGKDNKKIGIVITNNGKKYHDEIEFVSDGIISVYYGNNLQNIKTFKKKFVVTGNSYFKKGKKIYITSDKKIGIKGLSKADFDGSFYVYREKDGFVAVNALNIEKYLYGVVSSEMPASFETEALKAQAVCARTYTYAHLDNEKYKKYNAIMDDTVTYQAYGNTKAAKNVKEAVKDTRGEILTTKEGNLINAYYFSTSCGYTTDFRIWNDGNISYLKSKYVSKQENVIDVSTKDYFNQFIKKEYEDYEKNCSFYRWNVTINAKTIKNKLYEVCGENIGDIIKINVAKRGAGGIVSELEIVGEKGKCIVNNQNKMRQILSPYGYTLKLNDGSNRKNMSSLPSAFFVVDKKADNKYLLTGGGFGHGSGMSQYGAHEMAKAGINYKEILNFFYTDIICDQTYIH